MSGHNKWSSIKHKKGAADAKRGKLFTKLVKEIIIAARNGGGDPSSNTRLRAAVNTAKNSNMPAANIEKAIKRGTGELEGITYEECSYEGYGPNGIAVILDAMTDNKKRTVAEIRHIFSKYGGSLAENGAVSYLFDNKGMIVTPVMNFPEDDFMMLALDLGADDVIKEEDKFIVYTSVEDFHKVLTNFEKENIEIETAELTKIPRNYINADDFAEKILNLLDKLDDIDDVQKIYANYEISDEVMQRLTKD